MTTPRKAFLMTVSALALGLGIAAIFTATPQAAATGTAANKEEIRQIMREYLQENPEIVIEAIESYQQNQEAIEQRKFSQTFAAVKDDLTASGAPFVGNPDADVVIVEFFDYNCGYCKKAMADINKVLEKDKNVKFVFKEMPILSNASHDAARYALAAHKQGKYFEYHQGLMTMGGGKTKQTLEELGAKLGLDVAKLGKDAESKEVREQIEASLALSRKLGIRGTPAFIIGDVLAPGYMTHDAMLELIGQVRNDKG